jgi:hypothetical protein
MCTALQENFHPITKERTFLFCAKKTEYNHQQQQQQQLELSGMENFRTRARHESIFSIHACTRAPMIDDTLIVHDYVHTVVYISHFCRVVSLSLLYNLPLSLLKKHFNCHGRVRERIESDY